MTQAVEAVVIGAGVVGLAIARALGRAGTEVVVLEAERSIGAHASARNSEVIHAGIYYPPESLKARLCLAGKQALYAWCEDRGVAHQRLGKLIVAATKDECAVLDRLAANAQACGLDDLERWTRDQVQRVEPELDVVEALWSPSTGIVDSHGMMRSLLADAKDAGVMVAWQTEPKAIAVEDRGFVVEAADVLLRTTLVVNAAGLGAQAVAARIDGLPAQRIPTRYLAKGSYFALHRRAPFSHLVYPVPATASLGVHVTLDLDGRARFGPDQQWVEAIDYAVDPHRGDAFYDAVRRYWPGLPDGVLEPDYAGIRAKVQGPGEPMADFILDGPDDHGIPGLLNLYGIESPGLTASLAIAAESLRRLGVQGDA